MPPRALFVAAISLLTSACLVVGDDDNGKGTEVNLSTPIGAIAAETGPGAGETGLPVYPGAQLAQDDDDGSPEQAKVSVGTPWFGLHVRAAEYRTADAPERVLDFYRERMKAFGAVTECRGDIDFRNGSPVCRPDAGSRDVQLLTGTEDRHRLVSIKPRRAGSRFALVSIQTGSSR